MFLAIIGGVFVAMGVFCGSVLVLSPLGVTPWQTGAALWILFPVFTVVGYAVIVAGSKTAHSRAMSAAVSAVLLLLATAAAVGLVLQATGIVKPEGSTESLWYVLVIGGLSGFIGVAARGKSEGTAPTSA